MREVQSCALYDLPLKPFIGIVSKHDVAIKLEAVDVELSQVKHEYKVYKSLAGGIGIPSVYWFGTECDYNVLVLEHLGPSLKDLFNHCNCKFNLQTVCMPKIMLVGERCTDRNSDLTNRVYPLSSFRSWRHQARQFFNGCRRP